MVCFVDNMVKPLVIDDKRPEIQRGLTNKDLADLAAGGKELCLASSLTRMLLRRAEHIITLAIAYAVYGCLCYHTNMVQTPIERYEGLETQIITPDVNALAGRLALTRTIQASELEAKLQERDPEIHILHRYRPNAVVPDPFDISKYPLEEAIAAGRVVQGTEKDLIAPNQIFFAPASYGGDNYAPGREEPDDYTRLNPKVEGPNSVNWRPDNILTTTHRQNAGLLEGLHLDRDEETTDARDVDWTEKDANYGNRFGVCYRGRSALWVVSQIIAPQQLRMPDARTKVIRIIFEKDEVYQASTGLMVHDGGTVLSVGEAAIKDTLRGFLDNPHFHDNPKSYLQAPRANLNVTGFFLLNGAFWQTNRHRLGLPPL